MADRLTELLEADDLEGVIALALNARHLADEGKFCECREPVVQGVDLMCRDCCRENREQIKKREAWMAEPHAFEPYERAPFMCRRCSMWEDDERHLLTEPSTASTPGSSHSRRSNAD